jgi:hypothetical protein
MRRFTVKSQYSPGDVFSIGVRVDALTAQAAAEQRLSTLSSRARDVERLFVVEPDGSGYLFDVVPPLPAPPQPTVKRA